MDGATWQDNAREMLQKAAEPVKQPFTRRPRGPETSPIIDRRKAERLALQLPVAYTFVLPGELLRGMAATTNVSGGGIQFTVTRMMASQTTCQIELTLPSQPQPLPLAGRVVWCRQGRGKERARYEVGIAFTIPDTYDDPAFSRYSTFIATQLLARHLR